MANNNEIGAGDLNPIEFGSEFGAISFIVRQMMSSMDTMKLVKVVAVNGGGGAVAKVGTVDVQPLVSMVDGADNATVHGTVHGLPWMRMQGGNGAIIADPKVGDIGFVVVADRDSSNVSGGNTVTPGSSRKHHISDGVYVGGIYNDAPEQYIQFTETGMKFADKNGNKIEFTEDGAKVTDKSGNVIEGKSTGVEITPAGAGVKVNGDVIVTGNLKAQGDVIAKYNVAGSVGLSTHKHTQPNDSGGSVEQQTNAPTGGT